MCKHRFLDSQDKIPTLLKDSNLNLLLVITQRDQKHNDETFVSMHEQYFILCEQIQIDLQWLITGQQTNKQPEH